mgnify:CR=1 FL=1
MLKKVKLFKENKSSKTKVFLLNTYYNFIFVGLKMVLNLLMVPLLLTYIKEERYGIWQTTLSLVSFITVLNFGYPNGLRNLITKILINTSSKNIIGEAIGATYLKVGKITVLISIIIIPIIYFFVDPNFLFFETPIPSKEITYSLILFTSFYLINNVLILSDSIAFGYQKSYLTSFFQFIYFLLCYILIYFIGKKVNLNLIHISIIFGATQSVSYLLFIFYEKRRFNINIKFNSKFSLSETNKLSFHFFLAHLLAIIFLAIDNFIISSTLGAEETTKFSIVNRIFFTLVTFFSILLIHFWNSVTDAFEKKEFLWILKTVRVLYAISFGLFFIGLAISFFQKDIINIWLENNNLALESLTFYLFSIYILFHCLNAIFLNLQNGLGFLKIQIYTTTLALLLYTIGCYFIDIKLHGYNIIIILKIIVMAISTLLNSFILKKIKK